MAANLKAVDLFCGAGGASTGLLRAAKALGLTVELTAFNHWTTAVKTHELNHPGVRHVCQDVQTASPRQEVPGGRLNVLLAGPECTHHSSARGGRPINDQSRETAWAVVKWAQELYIDCILIENVPEFRSWGPVGANGKPLKSKKGQTFKAYIAALESLDYKVQVKELVSADYGDPTTRRRLFIMATRGNRRPSWPAATHSRTGDSTLFGPTKKWRAAREVIDWTMPGKSIFDRKKPLAPATMQRIIAGLERFGGPELAPFIVVLRQNMGGRSVDAPLPTITAGGMHLGIAEPVKPLDFVLSQQSGGAPRSVDAPLPTVATDGAIGLVTPFMVPMYGERPTQEPRTHSVSEPVPTIPATGGGKFGVVEPFLVTYHGNHSDRANEDRVQALDKPVPTLDTSNRFAVAEPFLTKYNGTAVTAQSIDAPVDTITGKDRLALVQPVVNGMALDIRFRMLQPTELAAAMSFPADYQFTGTREDVVKQIGNSWTGELAKALCQEVLQPYAAKRRTHQPLTKLGRTA